MTRHVLIVLPRQGRIWNWFARKVLKEITDPPKGGPCGDVVRTRIALHQERERATEEAGYAERNGYLAGQVAIEDTLPEVQRAIAETHQSFLKYRSELNRLSQFLGANFRGELPDLPSPADQAIALLQRLKRTTGSR